MINTEIFKCDKKELNIEMVTDFDIVAAALMLGDAINETEMLSKSLETITDIKKAITGRELGDAMVEYMGESIIDIAPAFRSKSVIDGIEQLEEGLRNANTAVANAVKKVLDAFVTFIEKVFPFTKSIGDKCLVYAKKLGGHKLDWKDKSGEITVIDSIGIGTIDIISPYEIVEISKKLIYSLNKKTKYEPIDISAWKDIVAITKKEKPYTDAALDALTRSKTVSKTSDAIKKYVLGQRTIYTYMDTLDNLQSVSTQIKKLLSKKNINYVFTTDKLSYGVSLLGGIRSIFDLLRRLIVHFTKRMSYGLRLAKQIKIVD